MAGCFRVGIVGAVMAAGCVVAHEPEEPAAGPFSPCVQTVTVAPDGEIIAVGDSLQVSAKVDWCDPPSVWSWSFTASDTLVIQVDQRGVVRALRPGTAAVRAMATGDGRNAIGVIAVTVVARP